MKPEIRNIIEKGLKNYRSKPIKISGKEYNLFIFSEDEALNLFEGFLFGEVKEKSELSYFKSGYKAPVSGYAPRLGLILYDEQLLIKDYRKRDKQIIKNLSKINKTFLSKIEKALSQPTEESFNKLFDRSDIIEEFYILYKNARDYLLANIKGIPEEERRDEFVDNFMMQMLTLWYLQERGFFNSDTSYLITKFNELKQKKLTKGFDSYYEFLTYFFDRICNNLDSQYYEDKIVGKAVVVGPAIFLNGKHDSKAISIADKCFYKEGLTYTLINTPPKKVSDDVPILNLFESRDWTEGNIDEYVLGAIYEKLITYLERKKLGAYYTPEEITSYICKNTIEPYLIDRVNEKFSKNFESIDQIIEASDKNILLYLFKQLKEIKILDPAVGSAHFLESAINVLLDVYEKVWEKARELGLRKGLEIIASDEKGKIKPIDLLEISDEKQFNLYVKFFIILSKNIYGVDINPSALKVAKARLFLTLAKHFDVNKNYFIRFPNVHFNLREGNSLIGYVQLEKVKPKGQATLDFFVKEGDAAYITKTSIKVVSELKGYLTETSKALDIEGNILKEVEELNKIISKKKIEWGDFEKVLRTKERLIKILIASLNSQYAEPINKLLNEITELFNKHLDEKFAEAHTIEAGALKEIKTFHWIFEFPEVFLYNRDGFDVVVGNPPYVELNETNYGYLLDASKDLYDAFIRVSIKMLNQNGMFGFIHANSAYCQPKFKDLRSFLEENTNNLVIINFAIRPQPVFKGVMQRTAITICKKNASKPKKVKTSRYIRLTEKNRSNVLANPPIYDSSNFAFKFEDFIPKIGNKYDYEIFRKLLSNNKMINDLIDKNGVTIFYHDSGESYWTKALSYEPKGIRDGQEGEASQWFGLKIKPTYADFVLCAINSTLFYWFWLTVSDCRHLTQEVIKQFPIPKADAFTTGSLKELSTIAKKLMECYKKNSYYVEKRVGYESLEFKVNRCKNTINEIDYLIGKMYGFTNQEVDYLTEYDLEMKMSGESDDI